MWGVSSDKFLYEETKSKGKIDRVIFRNRRKAVLHAIDKNSKELFYKLREESVFWFAYDLKYSIRQECRECQFSQDKRIEDITIGDFWGYNNDNIFDKNEVKKKRYFLFGI
ncbi:hypothetical protein GN277_26210 [Lachnospiraceae bacterium WCA-9-b2]|uniref:Uncharacterized protein n=1 Tax=Sporofaciens musculi TaxID=2681861 RepID=A0A7X3MLM2_9FIRM|nr:hypothetical protein [Sporofaciens musculi]